MLPRSANHYYSSRQIGFIFVLMKIFTSLALSLCPFAGEAFKIPGVTSKVAEVAAHQNCTGFNRKCGDHFGSLIYIKHLQRIIIALVFHSTFQLTAFYVCNRIGTLSLGQSNNLNAWNALWNLRLRQNFIDESSFHCLPF